ncbi:carboxypeptidase-like regulatory domain-containing protein [Aquimarina sp. 2201CG14-23]|uniref:carboxypeptidase-like regulatory domain-containing protein n=1 Tax=Aquimarina mycalae TaxID=3040073 RepID=UPI002477E778|nr:carboxypeptidase-like regulatory domain-containing protein [Aquimarina sp. 2201CG14-23]MDH7446093.1 carboxypeptidase-like regulatory domain-containing protein [Aquimarina sp. 2201CG14-23]
MKVNVQHIIISFCLLITSLMYSQQAIIQGTVTDISNNNIEGATVILYDGSNNMVAYTITNQTGAYTLENKIATGYLVEVTHIAFKKERKSITNIPTDGSHITLDFILKEDTNTLNEVIILSANKENDTVKLDLKKLNLFDDSSLKDILKKIPNFRLSDDGTIIYKGKSINKILVNEKESFVNQNSIALESIENKIIDGISIVNNYKDDFSLDFDEIEETVLNINTKKSTQNIINGSIEARYGVKNKYDIKANGLLFSKNVNAFLTNNTNNIGENITQIKEISAIFSENQAFSPYQASALNILFSSNENLKKDFFTNTNLTLRNQSKRLKTSAVFYYIAPNRLNSIINNIATIDGTSLLNSESTTKSKASSLLGAGSLAYKLTNKTILSYSINGNLIDNKNTNNITNQLFDNGLPNNTNTIISNNFYDTSSLLNQLSFTSKLRKNLIFDTRINLYQETNNLLNDYNINTNEFTDAQDYKYNKDNVKSSTYLKYRLTDQFISKLTFDYTNLEERLKDRTSETEVISREMNDYNINLDFSGNDLFKKVEYNLSISLNNVSNSTSLLDTKNSTFIPITFFTAYENKLNRISFEYNRIRSFNNLESGINTIQPFNQLVMGNIDFPSMFSTSNEFSTRYSYNSIFDGTSYSLSFSYNTRSDILKKYFLQLTNGISEFGLFNASSSKDFTIAGNYSKTFFQIDYPTKVDLSLSYTRDFYPFIINNEMIDVRDTKVSPKFKLETITDNLLNFSISSRFSFITNDAQSTSYDAVYNSNSASVLLKNKNWSGNLTFLYDNNKINDITYSRKNINFDISYTINKITFSAEARHIGELLSLINNDSYNSQFNLSDGISSLTINNQSLNYLILGIKYKL